MPLRPRSRTATCVGVAALSLVLTISALPRDVHADNVDWINASGGSAAIYTNWWDTNTALYKVPGKSDQATFDLANAYNVLWPAVADTVFDLQVTGGTPRFNINGTLQVLDQLALFADSLTLLTGTLRAPHFTLGSLSNASYLGSGGSQLICLDSLAESRWGFGGKSYATLIGGARIATNGWIEMGHGASDACTTTVAGRSPGLPVVYSGLTTLSSAGGSPRGDVIVGENGNALFQLENGGFANIAGNLFIAKGSLGQGMVHVYDPGGGLFTPSLTVQGQTVLGNADPVYPGGVGNILVEKGGVNLMGPCTVQYGTLVVRNGTALTAGDMFVNPSPNDGGGALDVLGAGSHATITSSLQIGGATMSPNYVDAGLDVDSSATLNYTGSPPVEVYQNGQIFVGAGSTLQSAADIEDRGTVQVVGTLQAPRLEVVGLPGVSTRLEADGSAVIRARLLIDALGSFNAQGTGNLITVGDSTATDGFVSNGGTFCASDTVLILDKDGADLGDLWLFSGTARVPSGGTVGAGHFLVGPGRFEGSLTNEGTISLPGGDELAVVGQLTQLTGVATGTGTLFIPNGSFLTARGLIDPLVLLSGALDFGPTPSQLDVVVGLLTTGTAKMTFRLGAKSSGIQDALFCSNGVTLAGKLDVRSDLLVPPVAGDTVTIITAASISGTFSSVTYNGGSPSSGAISVLYGPTTVRIAVIDPALGAPGGDGVTALRFASDGTLRSPAVALDLPHAADVKVALYDVSGREVAILATGPLAAGRHDLPLPSSRVPSGVYFGHAEVSDASGTHALNARVVMVR